MLKKPIAILLLSIYLFNLCGYSLIFGYFIRQSEQKLTQQLDQNKYSESGLVEIAIPLHLPYIQNSSGFERVDGAIENNGIHYNYVKRRVFNDTLYILCLPNQQKNQLAKAKSNYACQVNDFAGSKKEKESAVKKAAPGTEYNSNIAGYNFSIAIIISPAPHSPIDVSLIGGLIDGPEHPPQAACC